LASWQNICIKCKAGAFVVKCENGKIFNVHEGGKMCQAGAKGTIFYLFYAKGKILY